MNNVIDERGTSPGMAVHWHESLVEIYVSIDLKDGPARCGASPMVDFTSIIVSVHEMRMLSCRSWSKDVWDGEVAFAESTPSVTVSSPEGEG